MLCSPRVAKKGIRPWTNASVQMCLYPLFQTQSYHFLLPHLFWKLSQPSGKDQQNGTQNTVDYHPSPSQLISRIHPLIFLWTHNGFVSPKSFLNLSGTFRISPKLTRVLVTSFDKFHHLCNFSIFFYVLLCNKLASNMLKVL